MTYTALVVDDEDLIREIVAETLKSAGFVVLEAAHADEALIHLRTQGATIHLLFTDIHMPGEMNGLKLAQQTKRDWPNIAILMASGRPAPKRSEMPAGSRFVTKPYKPDAITKHALELTGAR